MRLWFCVSDNRCPDGRHGRHAHRRHRRRAMRDYAQRTVRSGRRLTRRRVVHMGSLNEAETEHQQHEHDCRALLQHGAFELA